MPKAHKAEIVIREAPSSRFAQREADSQLAAVRRDIDIMGEMMNNIATVVTEIVQTIRKRPFGLDQEIIEKLRTVLANRDSTERSILEASVRIQDAANRVADYSTRSEPSQAAQMMGELQAILAAQRKVLESLEAQHRNSAEPMQSP